MSDKSTRYNVQRNLVALIDSRPGWIGMPSLALGQSVRDLTDPQLEALSALLQTFEEHPRYRTADRYLSVANSPEAKRRRA
jgi:hypothetical protein